MESDSRSLSSSFNSGERLFKEPENIENFNPIIVVTGLSGAGKDYLLSKTRPSVPIINFGTLLSETFGIDRDDLRKTELDGQFLTNLLVNNVLNRGPLIFNAHLLVEKGGALVFYIANLRLINPSWIVLITADPCDIVNWRKNDITRRRVEQEPSEIELAQDLLISLVLRWCNRSGAGLIILPNSPLNNENNAQILQELFNSFFF